MLIKFPNPHIFCILVRRSGEPALSSSDVCVSQIESIKCLFRKDAIAKYGQSAPVIHGTLYFGIRGGEHIRILCRRTIRHRPRIGLLSQSRFWNPAGRGVTGRIFGYSPATPLSARTRRMLLHFKHNKSQSRFLPYLYNGVSALTAFLLSLPNPDALCRRAPRGSAPRSDGRLYKKAIFYA